jgi:copper/silver efflux system protein
MSVNVPKSTDFGCPTSESFSNEVRVLAGLIPTLWASGIGFDVMKPMRAPMVGGMITSTIHVLILVPVFFVLMKERVSWRGTLQPKLVH